MFFFASQKGLRCETTELFGSRVLPGGKEPFPARCFALQTVVAPLRALRQLEIDSPRIEVALIHVSLDLEKSWGWH